MDEVTFIKSLAVNHFNLQYGKQFDIETFCLSSITPIQGFTYAYEVITTRVDDFLRLRLYFNLTNKNKFSPYRVEVTYPVYSDMLGDEVHVAIGEVDSYYLDSNQYKFREINTCETNYLMAESGEVLTLENGEPILLE